MDRRRATLILIVWYVTTLVVELGGGLGFAWHAGWLGGIGVVSPGPIRVLFIEDVDLNGKADYEPYRRTLDSTLVTHYLREHCIKGKGGTPEWRRWDKDIDATNESDEFKRMFALPHDKYPWVVIEHESGGRYSGQMPDSIEGTLTLLKRWGGA